MGGISPTGGVVEWQEGDRLGLKPLLSASHESRGFSAGPGMVMVDFGWKGGAATESPEDWCREASRC